VINSNKGDDTQQLLNTNGNIGMQKKLSKELKQELGLPEEPGPTDF
jgi:hypothetical protein